MSQLRVIARAVASEGKAEELKALLRQMVKPTRIEKGCQFYELFESNISGLFYFNELWDSESDLNAHAQSAHFVQIMGQAKGLLKEPLEVNLVREVS